MYTSNSSKDPTRSRSNLAVRPSSGDWKSRPTSPSSNTSNTDLSNMIKRNVSPKPDGDRQNYGRRPLSSGATQSVAALQQHHKWLMQQQAENSSIPISRSSSHNTAQNYRSISPAPSRTTSNSKHYSQNQQHQYNSTVSTNNDDDVIFDDNLEVEDEGDDVEEEHIIITQDLRAKSPSFTRSSGGSIISMQPSFYHSSPTGSQESKVIKEGWLYRKNGLMQWKAVYAVAKHGNAVRPGSLYLYKDTKCANHVHTYDMSEVLEISPRAQEYKQGIKWEFRMLVKRDDVSFATDDMLSRKDWIDSLTSIMGKVSIATQNELTSRIQSSEQMNRDLQGVAEDLDAENTQLKHELQILTDELSKKDRFYQQELQNRGNELKEAFSKKERQLQQELQEKQEDIDRQRQAYEVKCQVLEREAMQWRNKLSEMEKRSKFSTADMDVKHQSKIDLLEDEIHKWRVRVNELENEIEYKNLKSEKYKNRNSGSFDDNSSNIRESMSDVKFSLQVLRDQIKSSMPEGSLTDIKETIDKVCTNLDEAKDSWEGLQKDIVKFLETEKEEGQMEKSSQKHIIELLRSDFVELREEITGVSCNESTEETDESIKKPLSLTEKFDILIEMIENVQISQSRLSSSITDQTNMSSSVSNQSLPNTPVSNTAPIKDREYELLHVVSSQQQQLSEWIEESKEIQASTLEKIESSIRQSRSLPSAPVDFGRLHDKIDKTLNAAMEEILANQKQGHEEQGKNLKIIGNYLQLISNDIQESSIPDLSALSQQLEDVVDRLNTTEEKLTLLHDSPVLHSGASKENEFTFHNVKPSDLSDDDKLSQLYYFVKNTEKFMEHSVRILNRYNDHPNGMEETIRRAVKGASKTQLEEIINLQEQNKQEKHLIEKKMERYEENARSYFEKSMERMHSDLHEFTGVMYEMLERLVLQALGHSSSSANDSNPQDSSSSYGKLSGVSELLKEDISKLESDRNKLEVTVKELRQLCNDLEKQIDRRQTELNSLKSEYDLTNSNIQRMRQEGVENLSKEFGSLMEQIIVLKKLANTTDKFSESASKKAHQNYTTSQTASGAYSNRFTRQSHENNDLSTNRFSNDNQDETDSDLNFHNILSSQSKRNSQFSENEKQQAGAKSSLIGSRDRPRRAKSPLAGYLNRNNT
ncbi:hypothetical protein EDC96DRAFT_482160 [Choanephora cucurbitarum]|nr:hypothetical protein EDC96DRAFT_482160 [Choanephora cucurbitarum]